MIPISDDPRRFAEGSQLLHADGRELTVESARSHRGRLLVKFEAIDTRVDADGLRGALFVTSDRVRDLEPSEFWHHDVIGCRAVDESGADIGVVTDVWVGPAQDVLVVATDHGERFIPMVTEIVKSVDTAAQTIVVRPPEGLLE